MVNSMSLIKSANKAQPILLVGKPGTGKTTKAREMLGEHISMYADEIEDRDWNSLEGNILIEEVHFKPDTEKIKDIIFRSRGEIILTSINEKGVPAAIKSLCKKRRVGTRNYLRESIKELAPHSDEPMVVEEGIVGLVMNYLKDKNREAIADLFKREKPADVQILSWLAENVPPSRLVFIDNQVKRRWSQDYFYEMLAYSHRGGIYGRPIFPQKRQYSQIPKICRKLGLKAEDTSVLSDLLNDEDFKSYCHSKLNNGDCRILGLEKTKRPATKALPKRESLGKWI
jgi:DNA polymerase III delta prime subunit